jgi:hypothetical protein
MAIKFFGTLGPSDITTTRTLLHETIPITGSILSGTYYEANPGASAFGGETNVKNYSHGMFQAVYDYPYLSSSANHIFDIAMGYSSTSVMSASTSVENAKKINMYNMFAQTLLGYTVSGAIEIPESDLIITDDDAQMREVFFVNFSRLLMKDQIKRGTFSISLITGSTNAIDLRGKTTLPITKLRDVSASNIAGTADCPAGDYGLLFNSPLTGAAQGVVFYQAGCAMITASMFATNSAAAASGRGDRENLDFTTNPDKPAGETYISISGALKSLPMSSSCDEFRRRVGNLSFNNTTELNSTVYFCRAPANKWNYSSNPTYTTGSKLRVKEVASDTPVSYITTVGLYNANNELLAVAKLSEPLKKDPSNEITLRVRLDF